MNYNESVFNILTLERNLGFIIIYTLSIICVLDSKVNSLNEFKKQRTQLIEKFLKQEEELSKTKEEKNSLLYETEKKLIIAKQQWVFT